MATENSREEGMPSDVRMKIQALADNELPEQEIDAVLQAIRDSSELRHEYAGLLRLRRRVGTGVPPAPSDEWIQEAQRRIARRVSGGIGNLLFIGSYVVLLAYAIYTMFRDPEVPLMVSVLILSGVVGFVVLLGNAIADRMRERKTDRYRGIMR